MLIFIFLITNKVFMSQVKQDDTVKVHYTGKLANGEVFDSSLERDPMEFQVGKGQLIPGFENGIIDMKVNEKKTLVIPMEEAYGEPRKELIQEVPKDKLPRNQARGWNGISFYDSRW